MVKEKSMEMPEILLVDEQESFRRGLRSALEQAGLPIAGDFSAQEEALAQKEHLHPDTVIVCSLSLAGWDSLVRSLLLWQPTITVIGIVEQPTDKAVMQALIEGVGLCLSRQQPLEEWLETIKQARSGQLKPEEVFIHHPLIARDALLYLAQPAGLATVQPMVPKVTNREGQVLRSLSEGIPLAETADRLGVSVDTVYEILALVRKKLMRVRWLQLLLDALC